MFSIVINVFSNAVSGEKTILMPKYFCPLGVESFESPNAIGKLEEGQAITRDFPFNRAGKIPICLQADFSYYSFCDGNNCTGYSEAKSGWIEIVANG